jgi:hypothetical protein
MTDYGNPERAEDFAWLLPYRYERGCRTGVECSCRKRETAVAVCRSSREPSHQPSHEPTSALPYLYPKPYPSRSNLALLPPEHTPCMASRLSLYRSLDLKASLCFGYPCSRRPRQPAAQRGGARGRSRPVPRHHAGHG